MAATPNSNYSSSPSPSPSPTTHNPAEWETRSQWRFSHVGEDTYNPLYRTPSPPPSTQSTPEWCKDDSPEGGRVYTPGLYDEDRDDEIQIPDIATLRITDNEEEEENVFRTPPPNHTHTSPHCCLLSSPPPPNHEHTTSYCPWSPLWSPPPPPSSKTRRHKHNPPHKLPANPNPATKNDTKK